MTCETIQIWPERPDVTLTTYLIDDSPDFQTGKSRPAVLILPGGGYLGTSDREAEPIALFFAAQGYHALVLRYAVLFQSYPNDLTHTPATNPFPSIFPQPLLDVASALRLIRNQATAWRIDPARIAVCGFSAGGHLAASIGTQWNSPLLHERLGGPVADFRPDALILGYPMIDYVLTTEIQARIPDNPLSDFLRLCEVAAFGHAEATDAEKDRLNPVRHVSSETPPAFIWHTTDDELVPLENSLALATALKKAGVPLELHVFAHGRHGLALADERTAADPGQINPAVQAWTGLALTWLEQLFQ
ncbi:MAG: alpha/beta hydrolase [Clostridia bacterium]|nr:alpha/beta hydrolase [Clostridia bacterium]